MTWLTTEPKCVNTKIQATAAILGQVTKINAKLGETNYQLDCRGKEKNARQNYTWNFNEDPILTGRGYIQKPKGVLTISNVKAEHQGVYTCLINKLRQGKYVGIASTKKFMLGIIGLKDGDGMKVVGPAQLVTIPPQRMSTLKLTMVTSVKSVGGGDGVKSGGKGYFIGIRGGATAPCLGKLFRIRQFSAVFGVAEGTHIIKMFKKPSETVF